MLIAYFFLLRTSPTIPLHHTTNMSSPKPDSTPHQMFSKAVRSLHTRRNAPPPIPIPVNPYSSVTKTSTRVQQPPDVPWVAVELSGYPPHITRGDVTRLFANLIIMPDFKLPNTLLLCYPLRAFVLVAGEQEAGRAVREVNGRVVGGRQVCVKIKGKADWE